MKREPAEEGSMFYSEVNFDSLDKSSSSSCLEWRDWRDCSMVERRGVIYDGELSVAGGICLSFNQRRRIVHVAVFFIYFFISWSVCTVTETSGCNFVLLWIFLM